MKAICILDLPNYRISSNEKANGLMRIKALETMFEAITRVNVAWLMTHAVPLLYRSGVRYQRDPERADIGEIWCDAPTILKAGHDDCEGLASFLAAEMRVKGPNSEVRERVPLACVRLKTTSLPGMLHAIVYDPASKRIWDPSRRLGMNKKAEF